MKTGDLEMFTNEGIYAKWFFGRFGRIETIRYSSDGKLHCRVKWLQPVKYHSRMTAYSDFPVSHFEVASD